MEVGAQENLHISEGKQLELHGDFFNVMNTANFSNPNNFDRSAVNFGKITSLGGEPREIQVAVRLVFWLRATSLLDPAHNWVWPS